MVFDFILFYGLLIKGYCAGIKGIFAFKRGLDFAG